MGRAKMDYSWSLPQAGGVLQIKKGRESKCQAFGWAATTWQSGSNWDFNADIHWLEFQL